MAVTAATARGAVAPRRAPARPPRRAPLRLVQTGARRRRGRGRRALVVAVVLVVGSLLAVVGAHAYLTQGQVRLTRLQQILQSERSTQRALELRVAELENPASIVARAQQQGMVPPTKVSDLPQVDLSAPSAGSGASSAGSAPAAPSATTGSGTAASKAAGSGSARHTTTTHRRSAPRPSSRSGPSR